MADSEEIFVAVGEETYGPLDVATLRSWLAEGHVTTSHYLWDATAGAWKTIGEDPRFAAPAYVAAPAAPPAPAPDPAPAPSADEKERPSAAAPPAPRGRLLLFGGAGILLLLLACAGIYWFAIRPSPGSAAESFEAAPAAIVLGEEEALPDEEALAEDTGSETAGDTASAAGETEATNP